MLYWRFKPPAPSQGIWEKTQRLLYLDMDVTSERISNEHWTCVCIWEVFLEWAFTCIFWVRFILSGACPFSVLPSPFSCAFAGSPRFQGPFGCHVFRHLMSKCLLCCLTQHCLFILWIWKTCGQWTKIALKHMVAVSRRSMKVLSAMKAV